MTLSLALQIPLALLGAHDPISPDLELQEPQAGASSEVSAASEDLNQLTVYLGQRMFDEEDWAPLEDQLTLGLEFSTETLGNAVGWEAGLMYSNDEDDIMGTSFEATTLEVYGGLHKTFLDPSSALRPYFGGGLAWITGEIEASGLGSVDDSSFGLYVHGGLRGQLTPSFFLGADLRLLLGTDVEFGGVSADVDYTQIALTASWLL